MSPRVAEKRLRSPSGRSSGVRKRRAPAKSGSRSARSTRTKAHARSKRWWSLGTLLRKPDRPPWLSLSERARRKMRVALLVVASIVAALAFVVGMLLTVMFRLDEIVVTGNAHYKPEQIQSIAGLKTGGSLAFAPVTEATRRLRADPWVASAVVKHDWPHTLQIEVVEKHAVATAKTSSNQFALLANDGTVLEVTTTTPRGFPFLVGVSTSDELRSALRDDDLTLTTIATALPDSLRPKVSQLQVQDGQFRLGLTNGVVVELGDDDRLGEKLMSAATVISQADNKTIRVLDVRSPSLPVAQPR